MPAGVDTGNYRTFRGDGEPGRNGGPNGDLQVIFSVRPHKLFRREGTTLYLDMPISFTQAALGADIEVPTLGGGKVSYHIPEGTQNDTQFRLRGEGIQQLRSNNRGDMILTVRVEIPKRLNEKQKDLLRQFEAVTSGKEYEGKKSFAEKIKEIFN